MNIWLDDLRDPETHAYAKGILPEGEVWTWVKTAGEAMDLIDDEFVAVLSLDHDLGPEEAGTGYDVARWLEEWATADTLLCFLRSFAFTPITL